MLTGLGEVGADDIGPRVGVNDGAAILLRQEITFIRDDPARSASAGEKHIRHNAGPAGMPLRFLMRLAGVNKPGRLAPAVRWAQCNQRLPPSIT